MQVGADGRWWEGGMVKEERARLRLVLEAACLLVSSFARGGRYNLLLGT